MTLAWNIAAPQMGSPLVKRTGHAHHRQNARIQTAQHQPTSSANDQRSFAMKHPANNILAESGAVQYICICMKARCKSNLEIDPNATVCTCIQPGVATTPLQAGLLEALRDFTASGLTTSWHSASRVGKDPSAVSWTSRLTPPSQHVEDAERDGGCH